MIDAVFYMTRGCISNYGGLHCLLCGGNRAGVADRFMMTRCLDCGNWQDIRPQSRKDLRAWSHKFSGCLDLVSRATRIKEWPLLRRAGRNARSQT